MWTGYKYQQKGIWISALLPVGCCVFGMKETVFKADDEALFGPLVVVYTASLLLSVSLLSCCEARISPQDQKN